MPLHSLDPITDRRWEEFVAIHPNSSVFHRREWLKSLSDTYGYRPLVFTHSPPQTALTDGIPFCEVKSWITGKRLVSLPFSDHSEPLVGEAENEGEFATELAANMQKMHLQYIELRPLCWQGPTSFFTPDQSYWIHKLDLRKSKEELFNNLHKSSLQRRIRKAERDHLEYERGFSANLIDDFCGLLLLTRRRHHLLPQPRLWFENLAKNLKSDFQIRVARKDGKSIAAIVTLRHGNKIVYKYGCSDEQYHHLAGMPFLFWRLIEESRDEQAVELDFGRTDLENEGLTRFKDQFGTVRSRLTYLRHPGVRRKSASSIHTQFPVAGQIFSVLPEAICWRLGGLLYRHMG